MESTGFVKKKAIAGLSWDLAGSLIQNGINFITSIFLARMLNSAEFGVVAIGMFFMSISRIFADFGFSSALIQNKDNTNLTYSSIFFINIIAGVILCLLFQAGAPYIGDFYNNPEITSIVRWLSLSFIFSSLNIVQYTILRRLVAFKVLTVRLAINQVICGITVVILAYLGWGAYALVGQFLLERLIGTILLWRAVEWRPQLQFSWLEVKKLTQFSTFIFFDQLVKNVFAKMDVLVIGKLFSPAILGFYSRAFLLTDLVNTYSTTSFTKVFFPILSQHQDDEKAFQRIYFKTVSIICFFSFLMTGVLYAMGKDIILVLFGNKWFPSVIIFKILILRAFTSPLNAMITNAILSKGKSKENFTMALFRNMISLIGYSVAFFGNLNALIATMVVMAIIITISNIFFVQRTIQLSVRLHLEKIFQGMMPFAILVAIDMLLLPASRPIYIDLLLATLYVSLYLAYSYFIKNEGLVFLIDNARPYLKKIGWLQKYVKI